MTIGLLISVKPVFATPFDRLIMPGKLIEAHKKYENECEKCHAPFKKEKQDSRCLVCHKFVKKDLVNKKGFHGLNKKVIKTDCKYCHTDHIGRKADIVNFDPLTFDHNFTNYPLQGNHKKLDCFSCHKKKQFRNLPTTCFACHEQNDIHKKQLGKNCKDCHNEQDWKNYKFDHDKTDYPLTFKHKKVKCNDCHPNQYFKNTPKTCINCHKLQDVHQNKYDKKCQSCHTTRAWNKINFNHDKDTKFRLVHRHKVIACSHCHKGNIYKDKISKKCFSCHNSDDKHGTTFGNKCKSCHDQKSWKNIHFNHDDTKFKLRYSHKKIDCQACHKGILYKEKLKTSCYFCHKTNDVHQGSLGKNCIKCHNQIKWKDKISFDHDLTPYPLLGIHVLTSCENCHQDETFIIKNQTCFDCHQALDIHDSTLGKNCALCHTANGWQQWTFNHDKQTEYPLTGRHADLSCKTCHKIREKHSEDIVLSDKCFSCHGDDDIHFGKFSNRCEQCHVTKGFDDLSEMNN